jgi:hypothetical protein
MVIDVVEQGNRWFHGVADAPVKADIEIIDTIHRPRRSDDSMIQ